MNRGPNWREGWNPFHELQREMGRLLESLDPFQSARHLRQFPPLNLYLTEVSGICGPLDVMMLRGNPPTLNSTSCATPHVSATGCHVDASYEDCSLASQPRDKMNATLRLDWSGSTWVGTLGMSVDGAFVQCNSSYAVWAKP